MSIADGVKAFVEPANKLIETVSRGIGTLYEPNKIRRMADAKAYEIEKISSAVRSNMDMPIIYNPENGVIVDASNFNELAERAGKRFLFHEITKQQNIDSVVSKAHDELKDVGDIPSDPVEQDWVLRFFNSVGEVSNEQMQNLWAKVLSGEVKKPGSFSLRTLNLLSSLSKKEADTIKEIAPYSINRHGVNFICGDVDLHSKYNYSKHLITLYDCGILAESLTTALTGVVDKNSVFLMAAGIALLSNSNNPIGYNISVIRFTPVGSELLKLFSFEQNKNYFIECFKKLKTQHPHLLLTGHNTLKFMGDSVEYAREDILI